MRVRSSLEVEIVALTALELSLLEQDIGKVLLGLLKTGTEPLVQLQIVWDVKSIYVDILYGDCKQCVNVNLIDGVSKKHLALLLGSKLENYILVGSRFFYTNLTGSVDDHELILHLERL